MKVVLLLFGIHSVISFSFMHNTLRNQQIPLWNNNNHHDNNNEMMMNEEKSEELSVKEGTLSVNRDGAMFKLRYWIHRPELLQNSNNSSQSNQSNSLITKKKPVVILHGGPSVPHNYLKPLIRRFPDRSLIMYDQLGCGKSDEPVNTGDNIYSIKLSVEDLIELLSEIGIVDFHLYGQSFGGILGYEFLKSVFSTDDIQSLPFQCKSFVLSSSPYSVPLVEEVAGALLKELLEEDPDSSTLSERFRLKHQTRCSIDNQMPLVLKEAYEYAGTEWRGTSAISDFVAQPQESNSKPSLLQVPALILRGEHDFVNDECIDGWKILFESFETRVMKDCGHHILLDNEEEYCEVLNNFFTKHDK